MSSTPPTLLCHYRYDPLDRLINQNQPDQPAHQRFYCKSRLATEIQGAIQHSIVQHDDQLLAQRQRQGDVVDTTLLATDLQRSVLQTLKANHQRQPIAYSPYGHRPAENGLLSLLGFNGERRDLVTGCYLLGNGYRAFNPVLMRFNSPDSLSPFKKGGLNSYIYCSGDPINFNDSSGHTGRSISILQSLHETYDNSSKAFFTRKMLRTQTPIRRRLSDPTPTTLPLVEPDFIGYHGTGKPQLEKLQKKGVLLRNIELKGDNRGFFLSPDVSTTFEYARKHEMINTKVTTPRGQIYGKSNVLEVHVRNFTGMRQGIDYDYNVYNYAHPIKPRSMEFFIANHKSRAIELRALGSTPESKKVRPRAHEAPF